jgi:hypothetical protein
MLHPLFKGTTIHYIAMFFCQQIDGTTLPLTKAEPLGGFPDPI